MPSPRTKTVFLLMGTSQSGRTHFANSRRLTSCVISSDDIKKELYGGEWLWYANHGTFTELLQRFRKALYSSAPYTNKIYLDYPFLTLTSRKQIYRIIEQAFWSNNIISKIVVLFFDTPLPVCLERNKRRPIPLPEKVITRQYKKLKWPEERKSAEYPFFVKTVDLYQEHYPDMPEWFCHRIHMHFNDCCKVIEECIKNGGEESVILSNRVLHSEPTHGSSNRSHNSSIHHLPSSSLAVGLYQEANKRSISALEKLGELAETSIWRQLARQAWSKTKRRRNKDIKE